jgi:hypothetical protein
MFGIGRSLAPEAWLAIALVWLAGTGCGGSGGQPLPKTHPVTGKVFYKGGQPLPGGVIEFQSESNPTLTTLGDIGPDGTFELSTLFQNERLHGAAEGPYHVTVIPRMSDNRPVALFQLPRLYAVKAEDNYFSIELEKTRDRAPR